MISILNVGNWAEQYSTLGERAFLSITMTIVGITIVLVVLALLAVVVSLMSRLINGSSDKKQATAAVPETKPEPAPAQTQAAAVQETKDEGPQQDDALVAAIAAAISCVLSDSSQPSAGFKIRRIRRV